MRVEEFDGMIFDAAQDRREEVEEKDRAAQRACRHPRWGFIALRTANGVEQIREGCPDCGYRENQTHPHRDHPGRSLYPLVFPGKFEPRRVHSYDDYLQSEAWLERREAAKARAGWRCQLCGAEGVPLDVHHNTYRRVGAELETDLTVLCRGCHRDFSDRGPLPESIWT